MDHNKKKIMLSLPTWAIERLDEILESEYCQGRGFKMTRTDLLEEMIANFKYEGEDYGIE